MKLMRKGHLRLFHKLEHAVLGFETVMQLGILDEYGNLTGKHSQRLLPILNKDVRGLVVFQIKDADLLA
ncbi:hypothetical protein D3C81_2264760 [compost metagenome]